MNNDFQSWGEDLRLSGYSDGDDNNSDGEDNNSDGEDNNSDGEDNNSHGEDNNSDGEDNNSHGGDNNHTDYTSHFQTELVFEHRDDLVKHVKETALSLGFVISIASSNLKDLFAKPRLYLDCSRSGSYRASKSSSKNTGTQKCNCPFRLKGHKQDKIWRIEVVNGVHNHQDIKYQEGHPYFGRLTKREMEIVKNMSANHSKPSQILTAIKNENPENKSTARTINNARAKLHVLEHAGRTQVQQLLHLLQTKSYTWRLRSDNETEELQDIFFAHTRSIEIFKSFPYILFMDCTYKTNRFRLPLLEIVGVTSPGDTFSVAFVFMQSEKVDNYIWALNCLRNILDGFDLPRVILTDRDMSIMRAVSVVFPDSYALLCKWHISNNVKVNCKSTLGGAWEGFQKQWKLIVDSNTLEEFQSNTQLMAMNYERYPIAIKYIGELLDNYKVQFVAFWTNQSMHYGNRTTNRAEAQHSKLKRYLRNSMGNLATVFEYIDEMIGSEYTKIKRNFERSRSYVQHTHIGPIFSQLRGYVAIPAMEHISKEMDRCNYVGSNGIEYCGCRLRVSHGLPCAHELHTYIVRGIPIPLDSIDVYWTKLDISVSRSLDEGLNCMPDVDKFISSFQSADKFNQAQMLRKMREAYDPATTPLVEPQQKTQGRGRPSASKRQETSTRRDSSAFEHIDGRARPSATGRRSSHTPSVSRAPRKNRQSFHERNPTEAPLESPNPLGYANEIPHVMHKFINGFSDVTGDGHCGFRAIAKALDLLHGEHSWIKVRTDLLNELVGNPYVYAAMFGDVLNKVYDALSFFESTGCLPEHWFTVSDMSHLVASAYNVAFVVLSRDSNTFLPWRTGPPQNPKTICIGHVNENHFVHLSLSHLPPLPEINPQWITWRQEEAGYWENLLQQQFQRYVNLEFMLQQQR